MTRRLSLFELSLPCLPAVVSPTTTAVRSFSASKFSDRPPANFHANSFPRGAGNFSNIRASISYQANRASRLAQGDRTRITRSSSSVTFNARFTRNGYSLPQANLSQTSAAMFAPYFVELSYLLRS
jgi:hypothetical protein